MPDPLDDVTIGNDERLLHRVRPEDIVVDSETGQLRPSSAAFRSTSNIISVAIASLTTPERILADYPNYSLVDVDVGTVRSLGCRVVREPLPGDPSHALLYGSGPDGRMKKSQAREIVKRCRWVSAGSNQ